jgi:hypothetical protein
MAKEALMAYEWAFKGERMPSVASGAPFQRVAPRGRVVKFPVEIEMRGAGAAYSASVVPLDWHVLAQLSGHTAIGSFGAGLEKYTYTPFSGPPYSSGFFSAYSRGQLWPIVGAYADLTITMEKAGIPHALFAVDARLDTTPTDVALPAITYNSTLYPPEGVGIALTIGTYNVPKVRKIEFKKKQVIHPRIDLSGAAPALGHAGYGMGRRDAELVIEIEEDTLATVAPWHTATTINPYEMMAGGAGTLAAQPPQMAVVFTVGGTQYNRWIFTANQAYLMDVKEGVDGSAAIVTLTFQLTPSTPTANDDYSIVFS